MMIHYLRHGQKMKIIKLSSSIYDQKKILESIHDFQELCTISIKYRDDYYCLCFENCKYDENKTISEFENYLIDLSNVRENL